MAFSSSSLSSPQYPYPSTFCVANFVSIKLSKDNYPLWKTQMDCLIVSQDLVGFIDGSISKPVPSNLTNQNELLWRRTDRLLKGWILGSLSEEVLVSVIHLETSRDVWADLEENLSTPAASSHEENKWLPAPSEDDHAQTERDLTKYVKLHKFAINGDWKQVEEFVDLHEDALSAKITKSSETLLHIAVGAGQKAVHFVEKFVKKMHKEALSSQDSQGDTALSVAAITGNTKAARILVKKERGLLYIKDNEDRLPVHLAARYGNKETFFCLFFITVMANIKVLLDDKTLHMLAVDLVESGFIGPALSLLKCSPTSSDGLILAAIAQKPSVFPSGDFLNLWQKIIYAGTPLPGKHSRPSFSFEFLRYCFISVFKGSYALLLRVLGLLVPEINKIRLKKMLHHDAIELVDTICDRITKSNDSALKEALKEALLEAGRLGIEEVVKQIVLEYPGAIWLKDENNFNIFQLAIIRRQEHVFKLIYRMSGQQRYLTSVKDVSNNNILHLAGKLAPRHKLELIAGPVLQMQRELQWFKEVENLVNSTQKNELNCYKQTPSMVFSAEHKELVVEGEKWLKGMANSATSILISAIIFAATFSIPGGYNGDDDRFSNSSKHLSFMVFVISESISLFASTTSLMVFLSILTTRFAENDFLIDLPRRLIIGLFSLFLSITSMMITFCATLYLVFGEKEKWVVVPMATLACLPVILFMSLQFPLFAYLIFSSYGPGIFGKHHR